MQNINFNVVIAVFILLAEIAVCYFFFYHGIKDGIVDNRIIGDLSGNYLEGKKAIARGIVFIFFGIISLFASIVTCIFLYKKLSGYS